MNRSHIIVTLLFLLLGTTWTLAQYDYPGQGEEDDANKKKERKGNYAESRFFFGGNLGLSFGSYTYIELAPIAGYRITPRLAAGIGPKYMYIKSKGLYETNLYGLKGFASFTIFKNISETINIGLGDIFAWAENETINTERFYPTPGGYASAGRFWYNITLVGGGLRFPIGARGGFSLMALWDVTQNPEYSYQNPEIRMIFDF